MKYSLYAMKNGTSVPCEISDAICQIPRSHNKEHCNYGNDITGFILHTAIKKTSFAFCGLVFLYVSVKD